MGKCLEALGSQQDAVGTPSVWLPFQLLPGLGGTTVKIVIGASRQEASLFPARRGDDAVPCSPLLTLSTSWGLSCSCC